MSFWLHPVRLQSQMFPKEGAEVWKTLMCLPSHELSDHVIPGSREKYVGGRGQEAAR